AAAAAVLLAAAALLWLRRAPAAPAAVEVASVERATGGVFSTAESGERRPLVADAAARSLRSGTKLETDGRGRVALRMAGGASVRLDSGTRAELLSPFLVALERGGVYVDTGGPAARGADVSVRTAAGLFRSIGTQFEVRADDGAVTRLKVREGRVRFERGRESLSAEAGQALAVRGDGTPERDHTAIDGPGWDWVLASAPMPDIEGATVRKFLDWLVRERGWRLEIADPETAALVDSVVLHGSIAHLTPAQAPDVVLPSSGLGYRVSGGRLVVFVAGKEPVRTPR
ncbi:MAG TPA: FecR family protein, partial [Thermoanaerobaculia bacterium]|nr:FecR family protein [Thermoanaerobaculia bacterium]